MDDSRVAIYAYRSIMQEEEEEKRLLDDFENIIEAMKGLGDARRTKIQHMAAYFMDEIEQLKQAHAQEIAEIKAEKDGSDLEYCTETFQQLNNEIHGLSNEIQDLSYDLSAQTSKTEHLRDRLSRQSKELEDARIENPSKTQLKKQLWQQKCLSESLQTRIDDYEDELGRLQFEVSTIPDVVKNECAIVEAFDKAISANVEIGEVLINPDVLYTDDENGNIRRIVMYGESQRTALQDAIDMLHTYPNRSNRQSRYLDLLSGQVEWLDWMIEHASQAKRCMLTQCYERNENILDLSDLCGVRKQLQWERSCETEIPE